jgi:hypothetical protein
MAYGLGDDALTREARARVVRWIDEATRVKDEDFTWCRAFDEVPAAARADSWSFCDRVFTAEASPHEAPGAQWGFHAGELDLVRHECQVRGLDLSVLEGRNFILVEVRFGDRGVLDLPPSERPAAIRRAAQALLRPPYLGGAHALAIPAQVEEGAFFSSDPAVDPALLSRWSQRVDGAVRGGQLYLVCYKKHGQRVGFAHAGQWFAGPR